MALIKEIRSEFDSTYNGTRVISQNNDSNNIIFKELKSTNEVYKTELNVSQETKTDINRDQNPKSSARISNKLNIIDVIKDYDWTYSAKSPIKNSEIPFIHLKEFKILGNSYMSSLMTSALLFPDIAESALGQNSAAANLFSKVKESFSDNTFGKFMSNIGNTTSDIVNKLSNTTQKATNWVKSQMESIDKTADEWGSSKQDLIDNYSYLYLRKPTNTEYKFPYFDNNFISLTNSFQDSYEGDAYKGAEAIFGQTLDLIKEAQGILSTPVALSEPGMYIQRPKFYNFSEDGYEIKVQFYLFNTINENSYLKNMEFITRFLIQNTPHRHNRLLVDPVCLYELTVPGRGFYPYSFVSLFNVNHVGTKRMLKGSQGNQIIVPDAFHIEISFKSLTSEVNNFIIPEMGTGGIDVSQRFGAGEIIKGMMNNSTESKATSQVTQPIKPSQIPISDQTRTIPVANKSSLGNTSQPIKIAMGF